MAKPIISKFSVIDAAQKNAVRYTCYDDTVNEVEYVVCDNASGNIIIDQKVQTSGASSIRTFTLPAGLVHNRLLPYYLKIAVKNQSGKQSDLSDAVLFYCHEKPVLKFTDVDSTTVTTIPFPAFSFDRRTCHPNCCRSSCSRKAKSSCRSSYWHSVPAQICRSRIPE